MRISRSQLCLFFSKFALNANSVYNIMTQDIMHYEKLTEENVWNLSEEEAARLIFYIQSDAVPKEKRGAYIRIINSAFEFRTISATRRDLRNSLTKLGFKFFKESETSRMLFGIYKKTAAHKSFYS